MIEKPKKQDLPNTYVIQDMQGEREIERLNVQDRMFTTGMGGVLTEQEDPSRFQRVLDVGCGTGGWLIQTAKTYPQIVELFGVDVNRTFIEHARSQAEVQNVADRVKFQVMDATMLLRFPERFFDLVNLRVGSSFLRTWEWPDMINKMLHKLKSEGILRVTESITDPQSNSSALNEFFRTFTSAFYKSGHLFDDSPSSLIDQLPGMLHQHGCADEKTQIHSIDLSAGTPGGEAYYKDFEHLIHTIKPFLNKWIGDVKDIEHVGQKALTDMRQPNFQATFTLITAWGIKDPPHQRSKVNG